MAFGFVLTIPKSFAEVITRAADTVTQIDFKLPGDLLVRYGTNEILTVDAESAVLPKLDIGIKNGVLTLAAKAPFKTDQPLKFTLTIQLLQGLMSEGSGNVWIENFFGTNIDIASKGSGKIRLKNIKSNRLSISIAGSGAVDASGSGAMAIETIDGSGMIDTTNFRAQFVEAHINGSGHIRVHADNRLNAVIRGAGNINYQGNPMVTQSVSGSGAIGKL
jgi:hypothetical protein